MLRLRAGSATLLIGPRAAAGVHGGRYCLESEAEIRQRLITALHDPAAREAIRRFWAHWQGDARVSGVKDHSIIDRIARMGVRGPLIVFLVTDISLHRRDTSASRRKQVTEALQTRNRAMPWQGPVRGPAPIAVSMVKPAATQPPAMVDRSVVAGPKQLVGDWTIAEKLTAIVVLTADSRKLSIDTQRQLKQMLSDPTFVAWLVGSLLVWFVSQFFVVGEILDMLLAGAALVLSGAGIVFAVQSLIGAAHLIGQFVEATREAKDENDLKKAADILAEIIVMIGITVLIAALTHATTRATSSGLEAKGSVKQPPPERRSANEPIRRQSDPAEQPKKTSNSESRGRTKTETQLDEMYEAAPAAKAEIDQMATEIANEHGGTVAKAPLKSKERALEKANNDYGGDASRVSDIARNTIVVPKEKISDVASALKDRGARVKEIAPETDEFGYSGVNAKVQTKAGIIGEIQVNSPEMIYAKEKPEVAREILGKDQHETIAQKYGVPGGKGHELYEKARTLPPDSPERAALAKESREYYDNFR